MSKKVEYRNGMEQYILQFVYESAKERIEAHPDIADKFQNIIQNYPYFKTEKEALEAAVKKEKDNPKWQIWAKIEKDEELYRIKDYYIMSNDYKVLQAAEYIGMAQIYG
jgi:arginine utilization protein RocB